jgi:glutamate/tyrosine decarboxylase-like PLP-dependent enzyme
MPQTPTVPGTGAQPPRRVAAAALSPDAFRRAGHQLVDLIAAALEHVPEGPVTPGESPEQVRAALGSAAPLPDAGTDVEALLRETVPLLFDHSLLNGHPRFFGYITSSPAPAGILADLVAAAVNPNVGAWQLSPMASEIEAQAIRWMAELIGYRSGCSGLFVSGGNMANIVGLFAARVAAAPWDLRRDGTAPAGAPRLRVYASRETHTWLQKFADLAGLGTGAVRWIDTDGRQRIDVEALRVALARDKAAGDRPMAVIGTAGTVSTGAVDPLADLAGLCREEGVWFHVDGAYGGLAAAVPGAPVDLQALGLADSVAVDPHKWLYAPLEAGCVLVRDDDSLRRAFAYHPPYYHFGQAATNYVDLGPQNSRGFRALKVWLALRQIGRDGYARMMADDIRLSEHLFARASAHPDLEACTQGLSITTFRVVPRDLRDRAADAAVSEYLNRLNEQVLERLQTSGEAFVSNAVVDGRFLLRACIVNFHTDTADVDALIEIAARLGRDADADLRPAALRTLAPRK